MEPPMEPFPWCLGLMVRFKEGHFGPGGVVVGGLHVVFWVLKISLKEKPEGL